MAKNKIRVKFAYDDKEVTGWVDFSEMRSCTINGKKKLFSACVQRDWRARLEIDKNPQIA